MFANGIMDLIENNFRRDTLRMNMKHALSKRLISKDDYMAQIKDIWELTATKIK